MTAFVSQYLCVCVSAGWLADDLRRGTGQVRSFSTTETAAKDAESNPFADAATPSEAPVNGAAPVAPEHERKIYVGNIAWKVRKATAVFASQPRSVPSHVWSLLACANPCIWRSAGSIARP